jgi:chromosome partitioning protein
MIDGRTVMEVEPEGRSAQEIIALWTYIADRLEKNFRRTVFAAPGKPAPQAGMARAQGGFGRRVAQ